MPYRLLIIDQDSRSNAAVVPFLKKDFEVESCTLATRALEYLRVNKPDLVLLDPDLPDLGGMAFLQVMRKTEQGKDVPVLLISTQKTEETVVQAFELGIDDYLIKPFDPRELIVRARTILRRRYERLEYYGNALAIAGVEIDPSQRRCIVQGKRVKLQPREFALLEIFMRKSGRVLTRPYLLETVWGMSSAADTRAVDVMVSRLRRRLGRAGKSIETISKMGYSFRDSQSA